MSTSYFIKNKLNTDLNNRSKKNIKNDILFDGDDILFKDLLKKTKIYFEYGSGKSTEYIYNNTKCTIFSASCPQTDLGKKTSRNRKENVKKTQRKRQETVPFERPKKDIFGRPMFPM